MRPRYLLAITLVSASCESGKGSSADTARIFLPPPAAAPIPAGQIANPCEHTGLWAECSLERRLKQSGFVVKKLDETAARAGFAIKPIVYSLGASRLEVFFYDDEKSAVKDVIQLDTIAVAPKGSRAAWPSTPTFIHSANLVAVLLTQNQRQAERVVLAITAGPPQTGSPR